MKVILLSAVALVVLVASSCGGDESTLTQRPVEKNVKVIIAGTNDALEEVTDGGIAGEGTFRATGASTDCPLVRDGASGPEGALARYASICDFFQGVVRTRDDDLYLLLNRALSEGRVVAATRRCHQHDKREC